MRKVFLDESLQNHFDKNGYIKIQLLDASSIEVLSQLYLNLTEDKTPGGFFSTIGETTAMKKLMYQHFEQHFIHLWSSVLSVYKPVFSNFITKKSANNKMGFHQDWSFIDENTGKCSLNIWCPLIETFHENGNLVVIPGSQHLKHQLRASNSQYSPYAAFQDGFTELAVELPTAAGEAIIFDNALIHGSTPNLHETNRLTTSILAIPAEEQIVIHLISEDQKMISLYKVHDDYLLNHNPFVDVPGSEFLYKQIPFEPIHHALEELQQLDSRQNAVTIDKAKTGFFKKILKTFR